jgi:hypothetical protein
MQVKEDLLAVSRVAIGRSIVVGYIVNRVALVQLVSHLRYLGPLVDDQVV